MKTQSYKDIDHYISLQPEHTREKLSEMRSLIRGVAPLAEEVISYNMPAFKQNGVLVYFAGYKHHIGFYPTGTGVSAFEKELTKYTYSKGAIQFPIDKPLPVALIKRIVKFRIQHNDEAARLKAVFTANKTKVK